MHHKESLETPTEYCYRSLYNVSLTYLRSVFAYYPSHEKIMDREIKSGRWLDISVTIQLFLV